MYIPNVLGQELEIARQHLEEAGFSDIVIVRYDSPKGFKDVDSLRVVRQREIPGAKEGENFVQLVVCGFKTAIE